MRFVRAGIFAWAVVPLLAVGAPAQDLGTKAALNTPRLQLFQGDGTNFVLVDDLYYEIKRTGRTIRVPSGFVTDFASVPLGAPGRRTRRIARKAMSGC